MDIERARQELFSQDETTGYIEREDAIDAFLKMADIPEAQDERYVSALEFVLPRLTPVIREEDIILGRMIESPVPYEMEGIPGGGFSHAGNPFKNSTSRCAGHLSLDYESLLKKGLSGIVREMEERAVSEREKHYAALSRRAIEAIRAFQYRYAEAAEKAGKLRQAKALKKSPYEPATDFFGAVQGVWFFEMILLCVIGGRDFAYSRLDKYLMPFYKEEEKEDVLEILESFILKNNEVGGFSADVGERKPVPCASSNVYLMLGGKGAAEALPVSLLFVEAALAVHLPQPILAVRLSKDSSAEWKTVCMDATMKLSGQMSFYNDDALIPNLRGLGFTEEQAENYTMSGCNRADFPGHMSSDTYMNCPQLLLNAFNDPAVNTMDGLLERFSEEVYNDAKKVRGHIWYDPEKEPRFFLESLLLRGCPERLLDMENGGQIQPTIVHHTMGIANVGNSLAAIQQLVFDEKKLTLSEYRELVASDFEKDPEMLTYILNRVPKYGNADPFADKWTREGTARIADAIRKVNEDAERTHIPGYYSLHFHNDYGWKTGATPDGRRAFTPLSENMSPTYGTDKKGFTCFLRSVACLPMEKAGCGGLNVRLDGKTDPKVLLTLTEAFFSMGGINLSVDAVSRETLLQAMANPDQYQTLCVRIVGFSEVFVRLPLYLQQEIVNRTSNLC